MFASVSKVSCQSDQIAAYIDGELESDELQQFEAHLSECAQCRAQLTEQRQLLCVLDATMMRNSEFSLPRNFARTVAVRAESDMRGMRDRAETWRALRICLLLTLAAFGMLGATTSGVVFGFARGMVRSVASVLDLAWSTLYDAIAGVVVISRVVGKGLVSGSHLAAFIGLILLALAGVLLSRLIARYHGARLVD